MGYNATEANNRSVEVCVEVVIGTVNQIASVDVQTVSQSATGLYYLKLLPMGIIIALYIIISQRIVISCP